MWGKIIGAILGLALIGALFYVLAPLGLSTSLNNQLAHFTDVFKFILENIKTISDIFPWALDAVLVFSALIVIEVIFTIYKISMLLIKTLNTK